ncbi:MAG TPA: SMP-30/gluconolactonase/LRE family protein, partial [Caldimonas sp.]|nr:SMP-30/gluconolactonase/LRE family protein [Caldimonas sp.]
MPTIAGSVRCVREAQATLGEGTCWSTRSQVLWWVDILDRRLHRHRPADGASDVWSFDEEISAVAERRTAPGLIVT